VAEHGGDAVASRALDIHEVGVRMLNQPLQFVTSSLILGERQQQFTGKRHLITLFVVEFWKMEQTLFL